MRVTLVIGQRAEIELSQPVLQQLDGGRYATARIAPGGRRIVLTGEDHGVETLRFQLEDDSEIDIEVDVG